MKPPPRVGAPPAPPSLDPATTAIVRRKIELAEITKEGLECRACPLFRSRKALCPAAGPIGKAELVIMAEAPGKMEDIIGAPLVGPSGHFLDKQLALLGGRRANVMVMNAVMCRPPRNRDPEPEEVAACRPFVVRQLALAGTYVGVALGRIATSALMNKRVKISKVRGEPFWAHGKVWIPTYHPAMVLRNQEENPEYLQLFRDDLSLAIAISKGHLASPRPTPAVMAKMMEGLLPGPEARARFQKQKWVLAYSTKLGHEVLYLADPGVITRVTAKVQRKVEAKLVTVWTFEELLRVGEIAESRELTLGGLRAIDQTKMAMGPGVEVLR